jgi:uncharacterized protein (TIGR02246 family)
MADDPGPVRDLYFKLLHEWNRRDASAMAALFSPADGQVGFDGSTANGPRAIEDHLRPIFSDHPTARFVGKVREVRMIAENAALLRAVAGMVPPGKDHIMPERNTIQTLVASRSDEGRWTIEMFHNTPAALHGRPDESRHLSEELEAELAVVTD